MLTSSIRLANGFELRVLRIGGELALHAVHGLFHVAANLAAGVRASNVSCGGFYSTLEGGCLLLESTNGMVGEFSAFGGTADLFSRDAGLTSGAAFSAKLGDGALGAADQGTELAPSWLRCLLWRRRRRSMSHRTVRRVPAICSERAGQHQRVRTRRRRTVRVGSTQLACVRPPASLLRGAGDPEGALRCGESLVNVRPPVSCVSCAHLLNRLCSPRWTQRLSARHTGFRRESKRRTRSTG